MIRKPDTKRREPPKFLPGSKVWLFSRNIRLKSQTSAAGCHLTVKNYTFEYKYSQDGDIVIGGIFTAHSWTIPWRANFREYRQLLTFIFAIDEINNDPDILSNITLGYHLYDSCGNVNKVIKDVLQIMSGHTATAPNYSCMDHGTVAGFIGDLQSITTLPMAQLLGVYGYTQVSYAARDPILSDRRLYPHFFRTVSDNEVQYAALVKMLIYFKWNMVCIFTTNDDTGERELRLLSKELAKSGIYTRRLCLNNKGEIIEPLMILNGLNKIYFNFSRIVETHIKYVGTFDVSLPQNQQLQMTPSDIVWIDNQVPNSRCSEKCIPGFRKAAKEGDHICCYNCISCSEGEISNESDAEKCQKCSYTEWPNEAREKCVPRMMDFLSYESDAVAYVFLLFSILSSIIIVVIFGIFIAYRNTPVVRANNRNLSFILLISLKLSLLCIFLFIGKPVDTTCMFRHISFGIIFTVVLSSILAKTIMVCIAFKATTPGSTWRKWMGVKFPNSIVLIVSSLQIMNGILWLSFSPPFQELDMDSYPGKIIIQCNEGSRLNFYFMLGYMGFLAALSFVLAFMVRTLPDIYNEAKYITFSLLVFCSVWIYAIPAYLSSKGKSMVSVEVFAILASGNGIVFSIFLPKLWNIQKKMDLNARLLFEK
ncbi:vomeronasal type-2 receptor 26-like [Rhinoderma darwinii]|uniref:vomeronasal type-2 receptor 26-like n=1 Tax=Rhinoderma darwinii TaxID=43563 RepID=UPI003F674E4E